MNPETLERLLIDRHLGELPSDASDLLDAYVAQNPSAAAAQARVQLALDLARRAMQPAHDERTPALPPLSRKPLPRVRPGKPHFRAWARQAALAAAIILAFMLGTRLNSPLMPTITPHGTTELVTAEHSRGPAPTDGFWTLSGRDRAASRMAPNRPHVDWPAPFTPPWKGQRS
jgi:hypothetical protein